jgi:putative hydrolase of the HAD superfamily
MAIKLITFDLDNTLWHTDPVIVKAEQVQWLWIEKLSPNAKDFFNHKILQQLKIKTAEQNPELRHKLSQLRLEFLKQVFIICGEPQKQAELFAQRTFEEFLHMRNQVELFPGAVELLENLQDEYQVIALSNGNSDLSRIGLDHLFNAHFHAENVAKPKPHSDMFLAALEHAKVDASECIHVGDHPEQDISAASKLGLTTIWANVLEQDWPEQLEKADHDISQLDQILSVIKSY